MIGFGQNRYHMDEVVTPGTCPNDTITYLKKDMSLVNGIVFSDNRGYLAIEYNYKNGKKHGLSRCWHENGQLSLEYNYTDGKSDGLFRWWYENGQLEYEAQWENDRRIYRKCWNKNGTKKACE